MLHAFRRAAALVAVVAFFASCSETSKSSRSTGGAPDRASPDRAAVSAEGAPRPGVDLGNRIRGDAPHGDVRVIFYQPRRVTRQGQTVEDLVMVMVNENNALRGTERGRYNISLQDPNRAYKVMTEEQTDALLKSLDNYGFARQATPFEPGDEQYLAGSSADIPRYRGVLFVESARGKFKVVGTQPGGSSDAMGAQRFKEFTEMKGVVAHWFRLDHVPSEMPVGGASPLPVQIDAWTDRRGR